ncbi:hypothetical protein ACEPPN_013479 [Leptodophora sp. 'Broadleaf-Isolate-01']
MKRHARPYGCTFLGCDKDFGSKNDWKRHENSQHFHLESWRCDTARLQAATCVKVCYRRKTFEQHLEQEHQIRDPEIVKKKLEGCRIGRNCQARFWCGFCVKLVDLKSKGLNAWTERFDHIDDHFMGRNCMPQQSIQEWIPVDDDKPKGHVAVLKEGNAPHLEEGKGGYEIRESDASLDYEWKGMMDQRGSDLDASIERKGEGFSPSLDDQDRLRSSQINYGKLSGDDGPAFSRAAKSGTHPKKSHSYKRAPAQKQPHVHSGFGKETRPTDNESTIPDTGETLQRPLKLERAIGSTARKLESNEDDSRSSRQIDKEKSPSTASMLSPTNTKHEKSEVVSEYPEKPEDSRSEKTSKARVFEEVLDGAITAKDLESRRSLDSVAKTESAGANSEDTSGIMWRFFDQCSLVLAVSASTLRNHPEILNRRSEKLLETCAETLFLWGESFQPPDLDYLANWSCDLKEAVVQFLFDIAKGLVQDLYPGFSEFADVSFQQKIDELSKTVLEGVGWHLHDDKTGQSSGADEKSKKCLDDSSSENQFSEDKDAGNQEEADTEDDFILDIYTSVQCLMDLLPSMEQALSARSESLAVDNLGDDDSGVGVVEPNTA